MHLITHCSLIFKPIHICHTTYFITLSSTSVHTSHILWIVYSPYKLDLSTAIITLYSHYSILSTFQCSIKLCLYSESQTNNLSKISLEPKSLVFTVVALFARRQVLFGLQFGSSVCGGTELHRVLLIRCHCFGLRRWSSTLLPPFFHVLYEVGGGFFVGCYATPSSLCLQQKWL